MDTKPLAKREPITLENTPMWMLFYITANGIGNL